ncbi:cytosolic thiouridylase subunit 2 isoform X2 [Tachypleus tridentatus]|uniref:cytosolic thiouridylase subunit 2 isoform X2 n=1 Tax=Tachypleus tridentatus TaxID=6853 RepID=UPI003FCEF841
MKSKRMCSEQPNEDFLAKVDLQKKSLYSSSCKKCGAKSDVVLRMLDSFCKPCFLTHCTHKFRATLGKSKQIKFGEKILVGFSGSAASVALVHMIQEGLKEEAHKRFSFTPGIVYVDEGQTMGLTVSEREKKCEEIIHMMKNSGYQCYFTSLEMAFEGYSEDRDLPVIRVEEVKLSSFLKESDSCDLQKTLSSLKSLTVKEEFLKYTRFQILTKIAKQLKFDKLFLGDTSTRLASAVLSGVAQGRGAQIAADVSFMDNRHKIPILKPLREFSSKEIAMYNHFQKIHYTVIPTFVTKKENRASVQRLTENFVAALQTDFPATVSTIFRTGSKLQSAVKKGSCDDNCIICKEDDFKTKCNVPCPCCKKDEHCEKPKTVLSSDHVTEYLCYGCRLIIKDMSDVSLLPSHLLYEAQKAKHRAKIKEDIQSFLLEGSDDM